MSNERKSRLRVILQDLTLEQENDNNDERMERTTAAIQEVQKLLAQGGVEERVCHPSENYLDSRVLRAASDLAVSCSLAVSGIDNKYDKHELALHMRENPNYWVFPFPREAPVISPLHGTFAPTPPEQKSRVLKKRVERQQAAQLKAPENVNRLEKTDEGSEMVSRVNRFVSKACRSGPLSYYHLVLDPTSFSRTIENIYYLSFLVRDGLISVFEDEEYGLPFVKSLSASEQQHQEGADKNQFVVSIDMERWRNLTDAFGIRTPMMVVKRI